MGSAALPLIAQILAQSWVILQNVPSTDPATGREQRRPVLSGLLGLSGSYPVMPTSYSELSSLSSGEHLSEKAPMSPEI